MTIIFAVVLLIAMGIAASLLFVLLHNHRRQTKAEGLPARFEEAAAAFNLSITKQEALGNRMIGIDERNNKLLFLEARGNKHDGYLIGLNEINDCVVAGAYGAIHENSLDGSSLECYVNRIALRLDYTNGANPTILTFYDKATNGESEMRELAEQAEAWQTSLSMRLAGTCDKVEKSKVPAKRTYASIIEEAAPLLRFDENTAYNSMHSSFS